MAQYAELVLEAHRNTMQVGVVFSIQGSTLKSVSYSEIDEYSAISGEFYNSQQLYDALQYANLGGYDITIEQKDNYFDTITIKAYMYGDSFTFDDVSITPDQYYLKIVSSKENVTPLVITGTVTNVTGTDNGAIDIEVTGGRAPYTYAWSNGAVTEDLNNLVPGDYTVTVTDSLGTVVEKTFEVQDRNIIINVLTTHVTCNGADNGTATIEIIGGEPPYTYLWSDGVTTKDRIGMAAEVYTFKVVDVNGGNNTIEITITQPDPIEITAEVDGNDITLNVTGGTAPYLYEWADGPTTKDRQDLVPGTYNVTVYDENLCSKSVAVVIAPFAFYFAGNPVLLELAAAAPETKPNLSFVCEVYIEKQYMSDVFEKVLTTEQPADTEGKTIFDAQEIIAAYVAEDIPDIAGTDIVITDTFRRFYLSYSEKFGDPPAPSGFTQQDTFYCLLGGLSDYAFATKKFMDQVLPNQKPFFTWWPKTKKELYPGQVEFIHYMVNSFALPSFHLKVKFDYTDGTTATMTKLSTIVEPFRFEVYRIPISYEALGIAVLGKEVKSFTLWIEDNAAAKISEERTYFVMPAKPRMRQFLYLNGLGCWETLVSMERITGNMRVKEEAISKLLPPNYLPTDSSEEVLHKTGTIKYQHGMLLKNKEAGHLVDFALSRRVFEIITGKLVPVKIDCSPDFLDEVENYNEFQFDVLPAEITRYTPAL